MPKIKVKCVVCKKQLLKFPSIINANKYGVACGRTCRARFAAKHLKGPMSGKFTGWSINRDYINVYFPNHPNKNRANNVPLHRLIMEAKIGRYLNKKEIVHHKDGDKYNNHWDNLEVLSASEHMIEHNKTRLRGSLGRFLKEIKK